ncbi:MAG: hypothetical protein ACKPKO_21140, partial [Candidatus Fonsibacter sp.]
NSSARAGVGGQQLSACTAMTTFVATLTLASSEPGTCNFNTYSSLHHTASCCQALNRYVPVAAPTYVTYGCM